MPETNSNRPLVGIGVYILNDKKQLLLTYRTTKHAPNTWCPPGGHLEFGESFLEGAKREAKEEVNLDIEDIEIMAVVNDIYQDEHRHYVNLNVRALKWSGEPKIMEPNKCAKIGWFDLDALPSPLLLANQHFFESNPLCLCGSGKRYKECHGV